VIPVTSSRNQLLKDVRKCLLRGTPTEDGCAVAETFHLLEEALRSDCAVPQVLAAESVKTVVESHVRSLRGVRLTVLADDLFAKLSSTETSQGVIALVRPPVWSLEHLLRGRSLVVLLDAVQDPGNAGTIVRAAEAFGATGVLFLKGSVSPFNSKTMRASAGSLFRLPFVHGIEGTLARTALDQKGIDVYAAVPAARVSLDDVDLTRRCALIVGSEGRGVSETLRAGACDLRIPTAGVESLNAAMAASILLYEASRQRRLRE
jgi:TrmH family RNA methyltransferase